MDLSGKKIGRLTVIKIIGKDNQNKPIWECICECGVIKGIRQNALAANKTNSCGCLIKDTRAVKHGHLKNGKKTFPEYQAWTNIKSRCFYKKFKNFKNWGGRGITMCDGWHYDFNAFLEDNGFRPSENHSVDRIDNNQHYSCGKCKHCIKNNWIFNCRWTTELIQKRNTRRNRWVEYNGEKMIVTDLAEKLGIDCRRLVERLNIESTEKAIDYILNIRKPGYKSGEENANSKSVAVFSINGELIKRYNCVKDVKKDGINSDSVYSAICLRKGRYKKQIWRYLDEQKTA